MCANMPAEYLTVSLHETWHFFETRTGLASECQADTETAELSSARKTDKAAGDTASEAPADRGRIGVLGQPLDERARGLSEC